MALILFDTNIFIDMLNGVHEATLELAQYDDPAISVITYMELRAGERREDEKALNKVLALFEVIQIDQAITDAAIALRKTSLQYPPKIKLPDAIIGATARVRGIPLVTRNPRDFERREIMVHVPYDYDSQTKTVSNVRPPVATPKPITQRDFFVPGGIRVAKPRTTQLGPLVRYERKTDD
jgi:hypothetical protein